MGNSGNGNPEPGKSSSTSSEQEDKQQQKFVKALKDTIEQLQTDIIVANSSKPKSSSTNTTDSPPQQHNLFQTFKITFRMFSLTVLHHDPQTPAADNTNTSTKRLLVDRMKLLSDTYFDWISTIDASNVTTINSGALDKQTLLKYHQALAYNDHFLLLMKPINCSLNQKINQRYLTGSTKPRQSGSQMIQYSLNEVALTVGYIHLNEYLVAVQPQGSTASDPSVTSSRRFRNAKIIEASQAATITELVGFSDASGGQAGAALEQPCFKLQVVVYEPLEAVSGLKKSALKRSGCDGSIQAQLLSHNFENITMNLNQSLSCELDVSVIDRLYYLLNDVSKYGGSSAGGRGVARSGEVVAVEKKFQNFEIKCSQVVKLALRFPIADLRRAQTTKVK